jgi:hypothetical protein
MASVSAAMARGCERDGLAFGEAGSRAERSVDQRDRFAEQRLRDISAAGPPDRLSSGVR